MSKQSAAAFLTPATVAGAGLLSFFNTASFVGWNGAGKATLVGLGTSFGGGLCAVAGGAAGVLGGMFLHAVTGRRGDTETFIAGGLLLGVLGGFGFGAYHAYQFSQDALTQNCTDICQKAPQAEKTASLDVPRQNVTVKI